MLLLLLAAGGAYAQPALLPRPAQAQWPPDGRCGPGVGSGFRLSVATPDPAVKEAAQRALKQLGAAETPTGAPLRLRYAPGGPNESYRLRVYADSVSLTAPATPGLLHGLATLQQLAVHDGRRSCLPRCDIQDAPRFPWRGLLLDPARHFLPVFVIKRNLDAMAAVKLNVLHWHLSDDQGWRVESRRFPRLQQVGGANGFYTQAEVREVVRYAAARGIRVVPEFDLPGHTGALLAAYPRLASNDSLRGAVPTRWGVLNIALDPSRETTYAFLDSLLTEMGGLFPDPYLHLGGDENDGRQWRHNPRIVAFMREKKMVKADGQTPDKHQLQTYFNRRMLAIVQRLGKTMVGWDEILGPDLPAPVVIESWRGPKGVQDAARLGHPTLRAHGYYIDLNYPAAAHYAADPHEGVPDSLRARVLGGEAAMWDEFADSTLVDSRIWPRAAAVAERLWSPAATTQNTADLYRRLDAVSGQLERLGLRHRRAPALLLEKMSAPLPAALPALQTLAGAVEPVKEYKRHFQGFKYSTETPLNRLVDAAPAESDAARRFAATADSLVTGLPAAPAGTSPRLPRTPAARRQLAALRQQLQQWQAAQARVQPLLLLSPALTEYGPLATQLSALAATLLQRLQQLERGQAPAPAWLAAARQTLEAAKKPAGQAEVAPALRQAASRLLN